VKVQLQPQQLHSLRSKLRSEPCGAKIVRDVSAGCIPRNRLKWGFFAVLPRAYSFSFIPKGLEDPEGREENPVWDGG
jgi:hypothetical protein